MRLHRIDRLGSCLAALRGLILCSALGACDANNTGSATTNADCPDFTRIVTGTFGRSGESLNWTFEVEAMPGQFVVDQAEVPDSFEEYSWEIRVDADDDGQDELEISAVHFKRPNSTPKVSSEVLDFTQQSLWRIQPDSGVLIQSVQTSLDGSVFTFAVDANADAALASVQIAAQCTWKTLFRFGSQPQNTCTDTWRPDR